ncbi:MAG: glycine cleavage system protein GcvH [Alphaproteobacteria bacterium]|nr:glycine cleavage system protein GcvH [Alphaproteobacteria bacterium]
MAGEFYTKEHEWVRLEGDTAICGISEFAQKALGDVVYVELPKVGAEVKAGQQVAVVESVKAASEIYAPVSGKVIEVNQALVNDPSLVNSAPLAAGWFFKLTAKGGDQVSQLMDEATYNRFANGN